MRGNIHDRRGFTLIELLLVIAIIGLIATIVLVGQQTTQAKSRDTRRVSDIDQLQKALSLDLAQAQQYPTYTGCITGTDPVTTELQTRALVGAGSKLIDPLYPTDTTKCYYYAGTGSAYTLRYTLETNSQFGTPGDHTVVP